MPELIGQGPEEFYMSNTSIGEVPQNAKRTPVVAGGEWKETPYFGPGLKEDSQHMKAFPVGMEIAGFVRALRTTKAEKESDQKDYVCMEDVNGNKFRIAAPGQLYYNLEAVGVGALVAIKYLGKQKVEGYKQELHQFEIVRLDLN